MLLGFAYLFNVKPPDAYRKTALENRRKWVFLQRQRGAKGLRWALSAQSLLSAGLGIICDEIH